MCSPVLVDTSKHRRSADASRERLPIRDDDSASTACEWAPAGANMVVAETALWEERNADKAGYARKNLLVRNDRNPKFRSVDYY